MHEQADSLRKQIEATEAQLRSLQSQLQKVELEAKVVRQTERAQLGDTSGQRCDGIFHTPQQPDDGTVATSIPTQSGASYGTGAPQPGEPVWPLLDNEYRRYGRQMIMPEVGLQGQLRLKNAKVLIVGVGGLGCPAAAYLAGAGIGTLGLIDGDTVEISNLHRQIAHASTREGMSKVDSAYEYLQSLNPLVHYIRYGFHLSPEKAVSIFEQYDLVLDCTDHPTSRYLISDTAVVTGKPLVSASALKTEGQLVLLNNPPRPPGDTSGGPCYRCIFPKPPPAESVLSCGEGGILGPVVGVMGVLQALEAIKVLTSRNKRPDHDALSMNGSTTSSQEPAKPTLLMFSAYSSPQFRSVRLRSRRNDCAVCSARAIITRQSLTSGSLDYVAFCGAAAPIELLQPQFRVSPSEFAKLRREDRNMLIDVRDEIQYGICALPGSVNVPWTGNAPSWLEKAQQSGVLTDDQREKYIVCRFGNDSQLAAKAMINFAEVPIDVKDVKGGFKSWREEVDKSWPDY
ncbi:hypothetical protein LTR37_005386 [Vermiconidia calcicola]|uniref:Uncharacterized protein n=1 Tax=Vermiconidia calcicola TaxID=1690605 RepID=A0ACC3NJU5_9PEZI|nr:hypothetical protein LTR37_005386 [Vermiconidia calcicola]